MEGQRFRGAERLSPAVPTPGVRRTAIPCGGPAPAERLPTGRQGYPASHTTCEGGCWRNRCGRIEEPSDGKRVEFVHSPMRLLFPLPARRMSHETSRPAVCAGPFRVHQTANRSRPPSTTRSPRRRGDDDGGRSVRTAAVLGRERPDRSLSLVSRPKPLLRLPVGSVSTVSVGPRDAVRALQAGNREKARKATAAAHAV